MNLKPDSPAQLAERLAGKLTAYASPSIRASNPNVQHLSVSIRIEERRGRVNDEPLNRPIRYPRKDAKSLVEIPLIRRRDE